MQKDLEWVDVNEIWEKFLELLNRKFDAVEISHELPWVTHFQP